jgi:hypothetical protein
MARRSTPERIAAARRAATIARLVSAGRSSAEAVVLVAEWEAGLDGGGRSADRADWERFDLWLAARDRTRRMRPDPP